MTLWNRTFALLCALTLSVAAAPAVQASDEGPFYVSLSGMWVIPRDESASQMFPNVGANGEALNAEAKLEFDNSFGFAAAFGYGELTGIRGEIEISYRKSDFDLSAGGTVGATRFDALTAKGDIGTWGVMANSIYAFDAMGFRPYVGAGIGLAEHDLTVDQIGHDADGDGTIDADENFRFTVSDDETAFAWQLMAGVGFAVSDSTEIRLGYRYFTTAEDYDTHNGELGIVHCF